MKHRAVHTPEPISPLGQTSTDVAAENYERSERYRAHHDRLAPYRVIARAVILARGAHGLTQKELGARIGTTDTAISRIESGRNPVTLDTLAKLGKALDLTFMVGSEKAARASQADEHCIVVPEIAIEAAVAAPTPIRRAPVGSRSDRYERPATFAALACRSSAKSTASKPQR